MKKEEKKQIVELVKRWLDLTDTHKACDCPFAKFDPYFGDEDDDNRFKEHFCIGLCMKYFPKGERAGISCPCMNYSLKKVAEIAEKIIEDYSNVKVRAKTRSMC